MSTCISDQAFSHTYLHINIQSKVTCWAHPGLCTHPTWVHINPAPCNTCTQPLFSKQLTNCTGLLPEDLTYILSGHRKFILQDFPPSSSSEESFWLVFCLVFICYPTWLSSLLLYLHSHDSILIHFTFHEENPPSIISYFWPCFQYLSACTHREWW